MFRKYESWFVEPFCQKTKEELVFLLSKMGFSGIDCMTCSVADEGGRSREVFKVKPRVINKLVYDMQDSDLRYQILVQEARGKIRVWQPSLVQKR